MVSGDVSKSLKKDYFSQTDNQQLQHCSKQNVKRFSNNYKLRPWPLMYHDGCTRRLSSSGRSFTKSDSRYKNTNINNYNIKNNNNINKNSVLLDRFSTTCNNEYNNHQINGNENNKKSSISPPLSISTNFDINIKKKTTNNYYIASKSYHGDILSYDNNNNLLLVAEDRDKYRFRKLRNPTQTTQQSRTCPCTRSKSMEDVRAAIVLDWSGIYSNNNNNNIDNFLDLNNGRENILKSNSIKNSSTRRSMDNLIKLNSNFGKHLQLQNDVIRPRFVAVTALEDVQAVRCAEFHPNGQVYSVGSNSKTFRICEYPSLADIKEAHTTYQPTVLFKRTKHHKGSIYCMAWSPQGDIVATGSNDKTVKLMRYNEDQKQLEGKETELTMHDGTVRDLCFLEDSTNKTSLLISGGAGDCKVYVTDCATSTPFQALSGHGGHILALYNWGGAMFVSGSQDKTVRFWDLRTRGCVNTVTPATVPGSRQGSPVASVCVDPSGRLLVSGHEDSSCVLYDIRGNRPIQCFKPHATDIRSIRFSPSAYYLLTGGYDNKLVLTDLQGDLTMPLPSVVVAQHSDKVISGRWHPTDFSFLSTSADKSATLWALPPL